MDITTIFLARVIGVYCLVMGASMFKRDMLMEVFRKLSSDRPLSYILGVLMFIFGLLLSFSHINFGTTLATIITLLGWGILLESAIFLFSSAKTASRYLLTLENKAIYYVIAIGYILLGAHLSYNGFAI